MATTRRVPQRRRRSRTPCMHSARKAAPSMHLSRALGVSRAWQSSSSWSVASRLPSSDELHAAKREVRQCQAQIETDRPVLPAAKRKIAAAELAQWLAEQRPAAERSEERRVGKE